MAIPEPQTEGLKTIFLFRIVDGKKTRYRFTLSDDHVIVEETAVPTSEPSSSLLGVKTTRTASGGLEVTSISPEAQKILSFFSNAPCWFSGCEELRQKYKAEMDEADSNKEHCRGCAKGPIMRKYQALVAQALSESA